jgi:hypothetical protein
MAIIKTQEKLIEVATQIEAFKKDNGVHAHVYSAESIKQLLAQPGLANIKVNYGYDQKGNITTVLHGVDVNNKNMFEVLASSPLMCPPNCEDQSTLMMV